MPLSDVTIAGLDGSPLDTAGLDGRTVLVVNVASKCGLTPQYTGLEALQERYADRGFTVLGVPCNQFAGQEPGSAEEIQTFCSTTYGVTFPLTEKVDVNGPDRHPLYDWLTTTPDAEGQAGDITWNFEKFLVGPDGAVAARFRPQVEPESDEVVAAIEGSSAPDSPPVTVGAVDVTDAADERLAPYRHLNDPGARRRVEARQGIFVVEGHLALEQLVGSAYPIESVAVSPERLERLAPVLARAGAPVYCVPRDVLAGTVGFDLHRGVVAVGRRTALPEPAALATAAGGLMVVAEGVNDHENLGALFRNARAFGAGAVLLDPTTADPLYRRSVRVSLGHVLRVPFARVRPWPEGLGDLRAAGWSVVALTPDPDAVPLEALRHPDGTGAGTALLVGAEGSGLSDAAMAAADVAVRIRMAAGVDSLNVATAAAVALHRLAVTGPR